MPIESSNQLGKWARELRQALAIDQAEFGKLVGYGRDVVGSFERGTYWRKTKRNSYQAALKDLCERFATDSELRARAETVKGFSSLSLIRHFGVVPLSPSPSLRPQGLAEETGSYGTATKIVNHQIENWGVLVHENTEFQAILTDSSMEPRFPINSSLTVAPDAGLNLNGPCYVKLKNRAPRLRIYLGQRQGSVVSLQSLNPLTNQEVPSAEIDWIYPVSSVATNYATGLSQFSKVSTG
jgi:hypothetical protein